ncbi:hypothetical protein JW933_02985 [candidate division FCPU426 bacterium]|nr:hypothetical protein [candidate division FCPU426 bacterium]
MHKDEPILSRAIGVVYIRKVLQGRGQDIEQEWLETLTAEEKKYYQAVIADDWSPIQVLDVLYQKAAAFLYPGNADGLWELGRAMAEYHLSGIYKIFVSLATTAFLVRQTPKLWRCYHRLGRVGVDWKAGEQYGKMTVEDYPELPEAFRSLLTGYITGALHVVGNREVAVMHAADDPHAWKWLATWKQ